MRVINRSRIINSYSSLDEAIDRGEPLDVLKRFYESCGEKNPMEEWARKMRADYPLSPRSNLRNYLERWHLPEDHALRTIAAIAQTSTLLEVDRIDIYDDDGKFITVLKNRDLW